MPTKRFSDGYDAPLSTAPLFLRSSHGYPASLSSLNAAPITFARSEYCAPSSATPRECGRSQQPRSLPQSLVLEHAASKQERWNVNGTVEYGNGSLKIQMDEIQSHCSSLSPCHHLVALVTVAGHTKWKDNRMNKLNTGIATILTSIFQAYFHPCKASVDLGAFHVQARVIYGEEKTLMSMATKVCCPAFLPCRIISTLPVLRSLDEGLRESVLDCDAERLERLLSALPGDVLATIRMPLSTENCDGGDENSHTLSVSA